MRPRRAGGRGSGGARTRETRPAAGEERTAPRTDVSGDLVVVGEITRAHGLRGAVRVLPVTDFPERLLTLRCAVIVQGPAARPVRIERAEAAGRFVLMTLDGVATPEAAEALRGATLAVPRADLPPLPAGQFYVFEVVGLRVRTPDGRTVGTVVDVLHTGSNDVYVIRSPDGREILLPAIEGTIDTIDVAGGEMVARPPEWI